MLDRQGKTKMQKYDDIIIQDNTEEIKSLEIYHGQYLNSVISKSTANKDNLNDKKIRFKN